uniref:Uncharacterized protein n=1 Tax=Romanomermis culicivorax TaxID=13658 RepID=A0A915I8P1_ROMCU
MMRSNSSLEESFDLILDQCPNLRYFCVNFLNAAQIRKLPIKAPNLQRFLLCTYSYSDVS